MKKIFGLALAAGLFTIQFANAQNQADFFPNQSRSEVSEKASQPASGRDEKKVQGKDANASASSNVYNSNKPVSQFAPPATAYNRSSGGFTVTRFKESKVARKLRRGEARSRFSVPDPKGKPLVHKRKGKFQLFG